MKPLRTMQNLSDMEYRRPDLQQAAADHKKLREIFENAESFEAQDKAWDEIEKLESEIQTMLTLAYTRHNINTLDEFYDAEVNYINENSYLLQEATTAFSKALTVAKFRPQLEEKYGAQVFALADLEQKTYDPVIAEDSVKESKLVNEYDKLIAAADIDFDGKKLNLAQVAAYFQDKDPEVRRAAINAYYGYFAEHEAEFDRIYDELVRVRHAIAQKLGFDNYIPLAYMRLGRTDYNAEDVARYREEIHKKIVPLSVKLRERQKERLGLDKMTFYDEGLMYLSGNPTPKGDPEWIVDRASEMYRELSPETDAFFSFMREYGMLDLVAKKGKSSGGYCTILPDYRAPFIFSNFNGTQGDVEVITHEAGHAFQSFMSRHAERLAYLFPTLEAAEIHSMSMEFFTWPWMENFFKEDVDKFKYSHLVGTLFFLPYGVAVDEFQHEIYANPDMTPAERKAVWKKMEEKYLPARDYDGQEYLDKGQIWVRQGHIFSSPFYYIDYTLAQVCAFQFWARDRKDHDDAWGDYVSLCKQGGSLPFTGLVAHANLKNPFEEGCLDDVIPELENWLESVDDKAF